MRSTWQLIAEQGLAAANMRSLARAAGYANGALAYYFDSKEDLLRAAFDHVFERTEQRIACATSGQRGMRALHTMCREILPEDRDKLLEARIVLAFWAEAVHDDALADLHEAAMQSWRRKLKRHLREAARCGEARPLSAQQTTVFAEQLLHLLMGTQVMGVLSPARNRPAVLRAALNAFLGSLARAAPTRRRPRSAG